MIKKRGIKNGYNNRWKRIRANLKIECEELKNKQINPKLAVIMVGDDPASKVYVRNKSKVCEDVGIEYKEYFVLSCMR